LFAQGFCSAEIKCSQASLVHPYSIFCAAVNWCVQLSIVVGYPLAGLFGQAVTVFPSAGFGVQSVSCCVASSSAPTIYGADFAG
jgi:hypothetical protein